MAEELKESKVLLVRCQISPPTAKSGSFCQEKEQEGEQHTNERKMTKFMIAVDGSEHSEKAYQIAAKILKADDEILFISVTPIVKENVDLSTSSKAKARGTAKELLDHWQKRASDDGVRKQNVHLYFC